MCRRESIWPIEIGRDSLSLSLSSALWSAELLYIGKDGHTYPELIDIVCLQSWPVMIGWHASGCWIVSSVCLLATCTSCS